MPDLEGTAVSVLRDWNSGKIQYHTPAPTVHPSSEPVNGQQTDVSMEGEQVGDAKILNILSEAFTLEGLFEMSAEGAEWAGDEMEGLEDIAEPLVSPLLVGKPTDTRRRDPLVTVKAPDSFAVAVPDSDESDIDLDDEVPIPTDSFPTPTALQQKGPVTSSTAKLFTAEELAVLPSGVLDRQRLKQQAKKAKKRKIAAEKTEGDLMLGFMDMGLQLEKPEIHLPSKRAKRKEKKKKVVVHRPTDKEADEEAMREAEFAKFISNVGGESPDRVLLISADEWPCLAEDDEDL